MTEFLVTGAWTVGGAAAGVLAAAWRMRGNAGIVNALRVIIFGGGGPPPIVPPK